MLIMKSGKHLTDGMEQQNQDKIKTLAENETDVGNSKGVNNNQPKKKNLQNGGLCCHSGPQREGKRM